MVGAGWVSAIATSVSTAIAAITLYLVWKDRQTKLGLHTSRIEPLPPVTFSGTPREVIDEFVTTLRERNKAHDKILHAAPSRLLGWTFGLLGGGLLILFLIVLLSGHPLIALVWLPINLGTVIAAWYYVIETNERRRQELVREINAQFEGFIRDKRFTPELAVELRNYLRPISKPATIAELDDYILADFARRLNDKLVIVKATL